MAVLNQLEAWTVILFDWLSKQQQKVSGVRDQSERVRMCMCVCVYVHVRSRWERKLGVC